MSWETEYELARRAATIATLRDVVEGLRGPDSGYVLGLAKDLAAARVQIEALTKARPTQDQIDEAHDAAIEAYMWRAACCPREDVPQCTECSRLISVASHIVTLIGALDPEQP